VGEGMKKRIAKNKDTATLKEQFIKKAAWVVDEEVGCWNATGYSNGEGYVYLSFKINGKFKNLGAHRASYITYKGSIPKGQCVLHKCDNRRCVNPEHLFIGSKKDNTRDMIKKRRVDRWEDRNKTRRKLSTQEIMEIYNSDKSSYALAREFPVSSTQIRRIRNGSRCAAITGCVGKRDDLKITGPVKLI
jgi:hypothetical protein